MERIRYVALSLALSAVGFLTACADRNIPQIPTPSLIPEPTPVVTQTNIPGPILPSVTTTLAPTPTPLSPTPVPSERLEPTPSPQKISCVYDAGSSTFDHVAEFLANKYGKEKKDLNQYNLTTFSDSKGNMTVFITKSGAYINFINDIVSNTEAAKQLPCAPEQVTRISVLIGGNDETNFSIPSNDIINGLTGLPSKLIAIYPNADITMYLPYITEEDASDPMIISKKNKVDEKVTQELSGAKKVTVIPLSPYTFSGGSVKEGIWRDKWHVKPEYMIEIMGGEKAVLP